MNKAYVCMLAGRSGASFLGLRLAADSPRIELNPLAPSMLDNIPAISYIRIYICTYVNLRNDFVCIDVRMQVQRTPIDEYRFEHLSMSPPLVLVFGPSRDEK